MAETPLRMLAAIMFTDMVGYTALMQEDEAEAMALRNRCREVLRTSVDEYGGKLLQFYGDGTLSMFGSAIQATRCAVKIQRLLREEPKVPLRIGVHVGDVVYEGEGVYGDAVNVASRIEALATPGGICVSGKVYDEIKNQPGLESKSLGQCELKNVKRPIEMFALTGEGLTIPDQRPAGKIHAVIVDDEELARKVLREYLSAHQEIKVLAECSNGFEAVKAITELQPDLVFLDIQMPKLNGFEVLELIDQKLRVIFVTAYDEFALRAFEVHAIDYLLKPFSQERFDEALAHAVETMDQRVDQPEAELAVAAHVKEKPLERVLVREGSRVHIILFLDIQMPKLNGFEVLELIDQKLRVIFVTAYDEFALRAFEVHAIDYLLKPFSQERFDEALAHAVETMDQRVDQPEAELAVAAHVKEKPLERVLVREGSRVHIIPVGKIDFIEAQDDYVCFRSEGKKYLKQETLSALEGELDPKHFVRIHRSCILNIERLAKIELYAKDSRVAILTDGTRLQVSRAGYVKLKQLL